MSVLKCSILSLALIGALAAPVQAAQVCYFGECGTTTSTPIKAVAPAAPDNGIKVLRNFGSWQVIMDSKGNRMIADSFSDHSKLVIGKENGVFEFVLVDGSWTLPADGTFDAKVLVDGQPFVGKAVTVTNQMLAIKDVSAKVMKAMYHGDKATIIIGGLSWDLSLKNAANAIDAAAGLDTAAE